MFNAIIQFILFLITSHKIFVLNKYWFSQNFSNFSFQSILFFVSHNFGIFFSLVFFSYTQKTSNFHNKYIENLDSSLIFFAGTISDVSRRTDRTLLTSFAYQQVTFSQRR